MPSVSVLMVVLDEEVHVGRAVRSVLDQTHRDLELLVIDGGSTDDTLGVVADLASRDPRVRVLANPARVIPAGLNVGLAAARGDHVARLDGHSVWGPDVLRLGLGVLAERPEVGGVGGRRIGVGTGPVGRGIAGALSSRLGVGDSLYHHGRRAQATDHATCGVYRTVAARAIGGWDEALTVNEDVDFDHRLRARGWTIRFEPAMETVWTVQPTVHRLFRQYRRYGRGKSQMVRKNGLAAIRLRHLAPPLLVLTTLGGLTAGAGARRWVPLAPVASYAVLLAAAGAISRRDSLDGSFAAFLASLMSMHYGWGVGFLEASVLGTRPQATSHVAPAAGRAA